MNRADYFYCLYKGDIDQDDIKEEENKSISIKKIYQTPLGTLIS